MLIEILLVVFLGSGGTLPALSILLWSAAACRRFLFGEACLAASFAFRTTARPEYRRASPVFALGFAF
jgi:hypothetical protein